MKLLQREIENNAAAFATAWPTQQAQAKAGLATEDPLFLTSYLRLASFQAWRSERLEATMPQGALEFFVEAHNDAVMSHLFSRQGIFRPALQSLRSCIENVYQALYYQDHPVELQLWVSGSHRIDRVQLEAYFELHPLIGGMDQSVTGLPALSKQYSMLNKAVHGSAKGFRMTTNATALQFFSNDPIRVKKWHSNETDVIQACNLLLLCMNREALTGTAFSNLRRTVSLAMSDAQRIAVKKHLKVVLPRP